MTPEEERLAEAFVEVSQWTETFLDGLYNIDLANTYAAVLLRLAGLADPDESQHRDLVLAQRREALELELLQLAEQINRTFK